MQSSCLQTWYAYCPELWSHYCFTPWLARFWDIYSSFANVVVLSQAIKSMKSIRSLVICGFSFLGIQAQEVEVVQEVVDLVQEVDLDLVVRGNSHSPVRIYAHKKHGWFVKHDLFVGSNVPWSLLHKCVILFFSICLHSLLEPLRCTNYYQAEIK
jgi:hypothetical protein